jgi:hypothetical protein
MHPTVLQPSIPSAPPSAVFLRQLLQSRMVATSGDDDSFVTSLNRSLNHSLLASLAGAAATIQMILAGPRRHALRRIGGVVALLAWAASYWLARARDRALQDAAGTRSALHSEAAMLLARLENLSPPSLPLRMSDCASQTDAWSPPRSALPPHMTAAPGALAPPPIAMQPGAVLPPPPPPPPPPPAMMLGARPRSAAGVPSAADLMMALGGLKQRSAAMDDDGANADDASGKKDAATLAGARSMGVSLDALLSVKLKVASNPEGNDEAKKEAVSTPEVVKARRRLKQTQKPASPVAAAPSKSPDAEGTDAHARSGSRKVASPRKRPRPATSHPSWANHATLKPVPSQRRVLSPLGAGQENARSKKTSSTQQRVCKGTREEPTQEHAAAQVVTAQVEDPESTKKDRFFEYMWGM